MISLKTWQPKTVPELDKLRSPESTVEFENATNYHNGYCWGKGICTSHTVKGSKSVYWRLGFWRAGGRRPNLQIRQTTMCFD